MRVREQAAVAAAAELAAREVELERQLAELADREGVAERERSAALDLGRAEARHAEVERAGEALAARERTLAAARYRAVNPPRISLSRPAVVAAGVVEPSVNTENIDDPVELEVADVDSESFSAAPATGLRLDTTMLADASHRVRAVGGGAVSTPVEC